MEEIDVRDLPCPGPVLSLRRALDAGELRVRLHVADELARSNVSRYAASRGAEATAEQHPAGGFLVTVRAHSAQAAGPEPEIACPVGAPAPSAAAAAGAEPPDSGESAGPAAAADSGGSPAGEQAAAGDAAVSLRDPERGPLVVQLAGEQLGAGDDGLGALLLRSFLKTLVAAELLPDTIICYNGGARLCCSGSPVLDDLRALQERGVELLVCGTCLSWFELSRQLELGRVTDMLEIATRLLQAGKLVRP